MDLVPPLEFLHDRILFIYWSTGKDLDIVDTLQVWDCVWSDTDLQSDHLERKKSYSKLPETCLMLPRKVFA